MRFFLLPNGYIIGMDNHKDAWFNCPEEIRHKYFFQYSLGLHEKVFFGAFLEVVFGSEEKFKIPRTSKEMCAMYHELK